MRNLFEGKKALLLDFDGTIGDTFGLHEAAFKKTLEPFGIAFHYMEHIGRSTREVIEEVLAEKAFSEKMIKLLVAQKRQAANDLYATHLGYIHGAENFVRKAHGLGYRLFVGSSGSKRNIYAGIEGLGLGKLIEATITSDDVSQGKPHPEIFLKLQEMAGLSKKECLVVEDAPSGVKAAVAAEIAVVCIDENIDKSALPESDVVHFSSFAKLAELLIPAARK